MHEASKRSARRIAGLEKQLAEAQAEADRIRGELEIPDAACRFEHDWATLVVEAEGTIAGALRATAHELDVLGRDALMATATRRPDGVVVAAWLGEEADEE